MEMIYSLPHLEVNVAHLSGEGDRISCFSRSNRGSTDVACTSSGYSCDLSGAATDTDTSPSRVLRLLCSLSYDSFDSDAYGDMSCHSHHYLSGTVYEIYNTATHLTDDITSNSMTWYLPYLTDTKFYFINFHSHDRGDKRILLSYVRRHRVDDNNASISGECLKSDCLLLPYLL